MNLENTKVYTTDKEVIRKYAELCGKDLYDFDLNMTSTVGVYNAKADRFIFDFAVGSVADSYFDKVTPEQINALYFEKFGNNPNQKTIDAMNEEDSEEITVGELFAGIETPEEAEVFESMAHGNHQLKNYDVSVFRPVVDVDGKLYTADDVRALLSLQDLPVNGWKNGDECLYMNHETVHLFLGIDPRRDGYAYIQAPCYSVNFVELSKLRKPETPQQREERERLEAAYDLYSHVQSSRAKLCCTYDWFLSGKMKNERERMLIIVGKTGYRKQKDGD